MSTRPHELDKNESASLPPVEVLTAVLKAAAEPNRYPTLFAEPLIARLADWLHLSTTNLAVGPGSATLFQQIVRSLPSTARAVCLGTPTFDAYPPLVEAASAPVRAIPLTPAGVHDLDAMAAALTPDVGAVVVCNPHTPTGSVVGLAGFDKFLALVPETTLVVLDEAYREYVRDTDTPDGLELVRRGAHPRLVALRTFSKAHGLAGLRVGYCAGAPDAIAAIRRVGVPYAISRPAEAGAMAAIAVAADLPARLEPLIAERRRVRDRLLALGLDIPASEANFLWLPLADNTDFTARCRSHGVLVRAFPGTGVRMTIGSSEQNNALLAAAAEYWPG